MTAEFSPVNTRAVLQSTNFILLGVKSNAFYIDFTTVVDYFVSYLIQRVSKQLTILLANHLF